MTASQQNPQALPDLAAWLAVQHQMDQEAIAAQTASGLAVLFPILKFADLNNSAQPWLHAVLLELEKQFNKSVTLGTQFVQQSLWAIDPTAGALVAPNIPFNADSVRASMITTGPAAIKRSTRVLALADQSFTAGIEKQVMGTAKTTTTGSGVKEAMQGGRDAVVDTTKMATVVPETEMTTRRNKKAIGYARFTDSDPCYFCAMLASRGAVYFDNAFNGSHFLGNNIAAVHDHCKCQMRPVFRTEDSKDDRAQYFTQQWEDLTSGRGGKDAIKAFRRGYVPPPPYETSPDVDLDGVQSNRDKLSDLLGEDSPQVKFYDDALSRLAA